MPSSPDTVALASVAISLLPVIAFLAALYALDSYRLVRPSAVVGALSAGAVAALLSLVVARSVLAWTGWTLHQYGAFVGPAMEEAFKASYVAYLVVSKRVGFAVDAAICGFAVGAGFALLENLFYLSAVDTTVQLSLVRGLGTAIVHGGSTAVVGIAAMRVAEERGVDGWIGLAVGFATAVAMHVFYNWVSARPFVAAGAGVVVVPTVLLAWFRESSENLRRWLGVGFDTDAELLEIMERGGLAKSRTGQYLSSLRDRFPPTVLADMFCILRLRAELSLRAKGILLMRRAGFRPPMDQEVAEKFRELNYLERSVGKTGMLAMLPLLSWRRRDLWEIHMLTARGLQGTGGE